MAISASKPVPTRSRCKFPVHQFTMSRFSNPEPVPGVRPTKALFVPGNDEMLIGYGDVIAAGVGREVKAIIIVSNSMATLFGTPV
jgi:hypothetical protein